MTPKAQNMKMGPDTIGTAENAKQENGTHALGTVENKKTPYVPSKTCSGAQNMKTRPDAQYMKKGPVALGTTENESERANHENGT
jgi:hypothetical protein